MTAPQIILSHKNKMVAVPATTAVGNLFPQAPTFSVGGQSYLALPHHPVETFLLRKLGLDVPAPILSHYAWPGKFTPFDVQRKTCALMTMNPRFYNLNGMGTGKTATALWSWDYLRSNGLAGKLLVIAPLSTLRRPWAVEAFQVLPHRTAVVLHGSKQKRQELLRGNSDIFIINHDGVRVVLDELLSCGDIDTLVLDELAVYRNGQASRTKSIRLLAKRMKYVWGMTGAPIPNLPTDAWAQASIITPNTVPKYFSHFRDMVMLHESKFRWVPKPDAVEKAYAALQPAVRYSLDDVVELPECIERTVDIELGDEQKRVYMELARTCQAAIAAKRVTAANAGVVMSKLMQVSLGWVYTTGGIAALDNGARIDALIDAVVGTDRKCIVFVPFKHALAGISDALKKEGIEHAVVSGDTPERQRADLFTAFQHSSKYHAIVAHPQCMAHGLTLTAADTIIWFGPVTSLDIYTQANARIRRVGQRHKQLYLHLQATAVEKKIYALLRKKQKVQDKLLELFEQATE